MATWKKVITEDNVENLATSDLHMTASRDFKMATNLNLKFLNEGQGDKTMFNLATSNSLSMCAFEADLIRFVSNMSFDVQMVSPGIINTSTVNSSAQGPNIVLFRDKRAADDSIVGGNANDALGSITFKGRATTSARDYAKISSHIESAANGIASGSLKIELKDNNTTTDAVEILPKSFGSLTSLQSIKIYGETLASLVSTLAAADNSAALAAIQLDVDQNEAASDQGIGFNTGLVAALQTDVDQNESDSDAADVTLQNNIDALDTALTTLNNYTTSLVGVISTATQNIIALGFRYTKNLKLRAAHNNAKGLLENTGTLFRHASLEHYQELDNVAYDIGTSDMSTWIGGTNPIDGARGTDGMMAQEADFSSGIADAWFTHRRRPSHPATTVTVEGYVWWQSKHDQVANQKIQFHWGYHHRDGDLETNIVDNDQFSFVYGGTASGEITLGSGYKINRIPISFTKDIAEQVHYAPGVDMFILAVKAEDTNGVDAIGQSDAEEAIHNSTFVADLDMEVKYT